MAARLRVVVGSAGLDGQWCSDPVGGPRGSSTVAVSTTDFFAEEKSIEDVPAAALRLSTRDEPAWERHSRSGTPVQIGHFGTRVPGRVV
ncbi:hypothetical protein ACWED2_41745 [Amycolatopsis sp. NPDC005003]